MLVNKKNEFVSIFSKSGKKLLKKYIKQFYLLKKGGAGAGAEAEAVKKRAESLKDNLTPEEKARILYMFAKREEEQKEEEEQKKLLETLPDLQTLTSNDILGMLPEHESEATDFAASDAVVDNAAVNNLWEHVYLPDTAQIYFYNKQTGNTQWEKPDGYTKHVNLPDDFDLPEVP